MLSHVLGTLATCLGIYGLDSSTSSSDALKPGPVASPTVADADEALRLYRDSFHRRSNVYALGFLQRADLVMDTIKGSGLVGNVLTTVSLAQLPFYAIYGDTIIGAAKTGIEKKMREDVAAMVDKSMPGISADFDNLSLKVLETRHKISKSLVAAGQDEGLTDSEIKVLQGTWQKLVQTDLKINMKQVRANTLGLRDVYRRQKTIERSVQALNQKLERVAQSVDELSQSIAEAEKNRAIRIVDKTLRDGNFEEVLALARACEGAPAGSVCERMDASDREAILIRGRIYDAAQKLGQAADIYMRSSLEIADNLGIALPKWSGKAMTGISAAASLASGISSNNYAQVAQGLVAVSSLFRKARPSPEQVILSRLDKIDQRLILMTKMLDHIDKKLDYILLKQDAMIASLARIEGEIAGQRRLMESMLSILKSVNDSQAGACKALFVHDDEAGAWSHFFKGRLLSAVANLSSQARRDQKAFRDRCREFIHARYQFGNNQTDPLFWSVPDSASNSKNGLAQEEAAELAIDRYELLMGQDSIGKLSPILVASVSSRSEMIARVSQRTKLHWDNDEGYAELRHSTRRLSVGKILSIASRAVVFFREDPSDRLAREALGTLERDLARAVLQRIIFDSDAGLIMVAVRHVEGGMALNDFVAVMAKELAFRGFRESAEPKLSADAVELNVRLAVRLLGDVLDASIWRATENLTDFGLRRDALRLAWLSEAWDVMENMLREMCFESDGKRVCVADIFTAKLRDDGGVILCLSESEEKHFALLGGAKCVDREGFISRFSWNDSPEVQGARFWLQALSAEQMAR